MASWEYVLDEALFTSPPHPEWSGAALMCDWQGGCLTGIGSLFVQEKIDDDEVLGATCSFRSISSYPIMDDLMTRGRRCGAGAALARHVHRSRRGRSLARERLGRRRPGGAQADIEPGDIVTEVAKKRVEGLADLFRTVWRQGPAGTEITLSLLREGRPLQVRIRSADRTDFLRKPSLQ